MAVNHSGDSDSTGSIAGNLLGLMYGLAADLIEVPHQCWQQGEDLDDQVFERYPGY